MSHENPHAISDAESAYVAALNSSQWHHWQTIFYEEEAREAERLGKRKEAAQLRAKAREHNRKAVEFANKAQHASVKLERLRKT